VSAVPPYRAYRHFFALFDNVVAANPLLDLCASYFRIPSADYADLLKTTSLLTQNHQDVLRAFRRMVFNVFAHNRDDHVKNFAFMLDDTGNDWTLSPAYDLLYTPGLGGEHTMTLAGEGRNPGRSHMHQLARQADISQIEAKRIIDEVQSAVAHWPDHATQANVSPSGIDRIAKSLSK